MFRPVRLVDQDTWFSSMKQGFDSPTGYQNIFLNLNLFDSELLNQYNIRD